MHSENEELLMTSQIKLKDISFYRIPIIEQFLQQGETKNSHQNEVTNSEYLQNNVDAMSRLAIVLVFTLNMLNIITFINFFLV